MEERYVGADDPLAKAAELAQRESELRLRSILDTVPDAIVVIDAQGIIQSFSLAAERLPAREAFALVFAAACNGGAYNRGLNGAYGRLAAWQSVAGLCGALLDASVAAVAQVEIIESG